MQYLSLSRFNSRLGISQFPANALVVDPLSLTTIRYHLNKARPTEIAYWEMFAKKSNTLDAIVDLVSHCRTKNYQRSHTEPDSSLLISTDDYRENPLIDSYNKNFQTPHNTAIMETDKYQPIYQRSLVKLTTNEMIKVAPTFEVHTATESSQIETLRVIAEQLIAHFDDGELKDLQFSNAAILGSKLMAIPKNEKHMRKLQDLFQVGNYQIIQSYLGNDQLVLVIARITDSLLSSHTLWGLSNMSSIPVDRVYDNKHDRPNKATRYYKHSNHGPLNTPEANNIGAKFIRHRRSSDYFTLYDEIKKVGAFGDIATITGYSKVVSRNEEHPISDAEGDSGYISSSSGTNLRFPKASESLIIKTGNCCMAAATEPLSEIHESFETPFTPPPLSKPPLISGSVLTARSTNSFRFLNSSAPLARKKLIVFPSYLPKPSANTPPSTVKAWYAPGDPSRLPISHKKGLSNRHPSACNVAPVGKLSLAAEFPNKTKLNKVTPSLLSDISGCDPMFQGPTKKTPKQLLKNYSKLRKLAATTSVTITSVIDKYENPQLEQAVHILAQSGIEPILAISGEKLSTNSTASSGHLTTSDDLKTKAKIKKPLKNFKKAKLLERENNHQDRLDRTASNNNTQVKAKNMEIHSLISGAITTSLCSSSDPARAQAGHSRRSSASSTILEIPLTPMPVDLKSKKPLKNFQITRSRAIAPKKLISSSQPQVLDIERTSISVQGKCTNFSPLPVVTPIHSDALSTKPHFPADQSSSSTTAHKSLIYDLKTISIDGVLQSTQSRLGDFARLSTKAMAGADTERLPITSHLPPNVGTAPTIRTLQKGDLSIPGNPHRTDNFITPTQMVDSCIITPSLAPKASKDSHKSHQIIKLSDIEDNNQSKGSDKANSKKHPQPIHPPGVYVTSKKKLCPASCVIPRRFLASQELVHFSGDYRASKRPDFASPATRGMGARRVSKIAKSPPMISREPAPPLVVILNAPSVVPSKRSKLGVSSARNSSKASYVHKLTWS